KSNKKPRLAAGSETTNPIFLLTGECEYRSQVENIAIRQDAGGTKPLGPQQHPRCGTDNVIAIDRVPSSAAGPALVGRASALRLIIHGCCSAPIGTSQRGCCVIGEISLGKINRC